MALVSGLGLLGSMGSLFGFTIQYVIRRIHAEPIKTLEKLVKCLDEGTHMIFARNPFRFEIFDHHFLIGDITEGRNNAGNVAHMEFSIFEFSSETSGDKENAMVGRKRLVLDKNRYGHWQITQEYRVREMIDRNGELKVTDEYAIKDDMDTISWNLDKTTEFFPKLWVVKRKKYPKSENERAAAVTRARNCCGKDLLRGKYNVLVNNCEHFVTYCLTEKGHSYQSGWKWWRRYQRLAEQAQRC